MPSSESSCSRHPRRHPPIKSLCIQCRSKPSVLSGHSRVETIRICRTVTAPPAGSRSHAGWQCSTTARPTNSMFGLPGAGSQRSTPSVGRGGLRSNPTSTSTPTPSPRRFDANSYLILTEAMNSHDVGRGRGSVATALRGIQARSLVLGIESDRYFPLSSQREIATHMPHRVPGLEPIVLQSEYGHDAFLIEDDAVGAAIAKLLTA